MNWLIIALALLVVLVIILIWYLLTSQGDVGTLKLELAAAVDQKNAAVKQYEAQKIALGDMTAQVGTLNTKITALQKQLDEAIKAGDAKAQELNLKLTAKINEVALLTKTIEEQKSQIETLSVQISEATVAKKLLGDQIATLTKDLATAQANLATLKASSTTSSTQLASVNAQISDLTGKLAEANTRITALTTNQAALQSKYDKLVSENNTALAQITTAQTEIKSLNERVATLVADLQSANTLLNAARIANTDLDAKIQLSISINTVVPKDYNLVRADKTLNCLTTTTDGKLALTPCSGVTNQLWNYDRTSGVISNRSGKIVAVANTNGVESVVLDNATTAPTNSQIWVPDNGYLKSKSAGKYLAVYQNSLSLLEKSSANVWVFANQILDISPVVLPPVDVGVPAECPAGYENIGGLCYSKCKDGYTAVGTLCYSNCPADWSGLPGTETAAHCAKTRTYSPGKVPASCPSGRTNINGLCYDSCPTGSSNDFGQVTSCRANCPAGSRQDPNSCYTAGDIKTRTQTYSPAKLPNLTCPAGTSEQWGLCYPSCPANYSMVSSGLCRENCPAGYRDDGSACWRDVYWVDAQIQNNIAPWDSCWGGYFRPTAGEWRCVRCPEGSVWDGSRCRFDTDRFDKKSQWVTAQNRVSNCPSTHPNKIGALCYANCASGTTRETSNLEFCSSTCPSGYTNDGLTCRKDPVITTRTVTKTLSAGTPLTCASGQTQKGALCYDGCAAGTQRIDADLEFCGSVCPTGMVDIGAGCQKISESRTIKPVTEVGTCPTGKKLVGALCYNV